MSKEIYISSTPQETRLAIVEKDELTEIYYERENEYTLAGSIYNGRVTRVLPGMQSSFVDIGLERDAFLYITDFMEEAGDSADFDGAEPRTERGDRPKGGEGRGEGRGRARREGRSEGRGREAQREPNGEPGGETSNEERPFDGRSQEELRSFAAVEDETADVLPRANDDEEVGEGASGADGGRRWRGRRGRRRGRGTGAEQQAEPLAGGEGVGNGIEAASDEERSSRGFQSHEFERQAEPRVERAGRENGRDRGGRDQERGRDNRHDAVRERFAPRGARPAPGDDQAIDVSASASQVEPFILPGESLSKYRRDGGGATSESAPAKIEGSVVKAKPSTEVEPLVGWDGGLVLPGESLSRARETRPEARSEANGEARGFDRSRDRNIDRNGDRGGERSGGRDRRRGRDEQRGRDRREYHAEPRGMDPAEAVLPAVTSQHDAARSEYEPRYEVTTDIAQADLAPAEMTEAEIGSVVEHEAEFQRAVEELEEAGFPEAEFHETEFHETTTEYEPEENASASFRVDPAGQREFRQSSTVEEPGVVVEQTREPETDVPDRAQTSGAHEFTSLQPTGELISDTPHAEDSRAEMAQSDPASPMEHETAVQSVHASETGRTAVPFAAAPETEEPEVEAQGFVPGDGQLLEEELLEDEDSGIGSLHASAFGDEGDTEEETLESAGGEAPDLGSMIRDMTIDDLTGIEPTEMEEEDEDDFDEDEDFEEDELAATNDDDFDEDAVSGSQISEAEEEEFAEASSFEENGGAAAVGEGEIAQREGVREGGRRGRRDGRRGGRDRGERERGGERDRGERGSRDRRGMASSRTGGRDRGRRSMQSVNLPAISDLLKPGQEVLVQIAKEPIAKKGARITSHIALPGRFLVFMPTVNHIGVSRKIESDSERRRLKEVLLSEQGDATGGFIVRTAAAGASEEELRSDLRFLLNLWADIKSRSEGSKSPALIYHDLNLVERILRDQVTDNFSAIWVDTEAEYERVLRFLQRFQPSLIRRVKLYTKDTPLFEQFGITEEINKALRSKVWLKSGGSIVINQTEALVAIDINTGKYVGKTARLEDTIVKTNLDAIPEIVRQIRLRDLGGIIIIDFIDMDERRNRNKVMAALEDELKKDRAPSKVLQFNDFGLVAITRKRVKQSLERTLSTTCGVCAGTGMVKSPVTVCNDIYIEMRKMHKLLEKSDIMLRVNPEVVKQLKNGGGKWLQEMEEMSGKTILVKSDPALHPEQFDIH